MCKPSRRTVQALRAECWATCSGPRNVHRRVASAPHLRTHARAAWESAQLRTAFRFRCHRCARVEIVEHYSGSFPAQMLDNFFELNGSGTNATPRKPELRMRAAFEVYLISFFGAAF